jgi:hypothetical protein
MDRDTTIIIVIITLDTIMVTDIEAMVTVMVLTGMAAALLVAPVNRPVKQYLPFLYLICLTKYDRMLSCSGNLVTLQKFLENCPEFKIVFYLVFVSNI